VLQVLEVSLLGPHLPRGPVQVQERRRKDRLEELPRTPAKRLDELQVQLRKGLDIVYGGASLWHRRPNSIGMIRLGGMHGLATSGQTGSMSECVQPGRLESVMIEPMTVAAVVTTGIYCRPGCGARPSPQNVRQYLLPAAAEAAGYRACLRCRPYRMEPPIIRTGPELVCRAVRLILDGALDGKTEHDLGARLFVSARHLRRLFLQHLGVTPDQLARSSRAHFARRLLDDTDLTIGEITFAAGFGSVRQLNRACRDLFRATPRELRARRRVSDRLVADGGLLLRLPFEPPLDWEPMLAYFEARAIAGVERVSDGVYRRTVLVDGDPGVLELSLGGTDHLLLRAHLPHWEGLIHLARRARRIFNLDCDTEGSARHLAQDPVVGPLVRARPGIRPPGTWDPFETGVRAVIGQCISLRGANTIAARLVERYGAPVPGLQALGLTHLFPTPSTLAGADLSGLGLSAGCAAAVSGFAGAVADADLTLDRAARLDQLATSIRAIRGLGPLTAHHLAFRMGDPDAFPATDLGLRRALSRGPPMAPREVERIAERWRPWRAQAAIHLWLDRPPIAW
jgi:AraC family transcriptional regulator of adaptative response / DNA-3-methyladenine glycosylase II